MKALRLLKFSILTIAFMAFFADSISQQLNTPGLSPRGKVSQTVGLTEIEIDYGRPSMRDRQIFGTGEDYLLQYGEIWRTGAGGTSKITFNDDVKVNGMDVPAGTYSIFTIPGAEEWKVMLYKDLSVNGNNPANYKEEDEAARFTVTPEKLDFKMESMLFAFGDLTTNTTKLNMLWEDVHISFDIDVGADAQVMEQIENVMENPEMATANLYATASGYYFNNGKDMATALVWINKALAINPSMFNYDSKANIQAKMEDYKGAIESCNMAHEAGKKSTEGLLAFYENTFSKQLDIKIKKWGSN